jgi:hypothetical protein
LQFGDNIKSIKNKNLSKTIIIKTNLNQYNIKDQNDNIDKLEKLLKDNSIDII